MRHLRQLHDLSDLTRDLRLAIRSARRRPLLSAIVVLTLGLGIGATTAVFAIADRVLLRPLPYADADRLISVTTTLVDRPDEPTSLAAAVLTAVADESRSLRGVAASSGTQLVVAAPSGPVALSGSQVSTNFFPVLGATPAIGQGFTASPLAQRPPNELVSRSRHGSRCSARIRESSAERSSWATSHTRSSA